MTGRSTSWKNSPSVTKSFPSMMLNYEVIVPTHLFSRLFKHQQQWCNLKRVSARLAMGRALAQRHVRSKVSWNFPSMGEVICKPVFRRKRASIRRWSAQSVILRFSFFAFVFDKDAPCWVRVGKIWVFFQQDASFSNTKVEKLKRMLSLLW